MRSIGFVTKQKDGSYKGSLNTLTVKAAIQIIPNTSKSADKQPDFRVVSKGTEIGAAWTKENQEGGKYVSVSLCDPSFGKLYANLGIAAGQDDPDTFAVIWNPRD
jgi:uncharacterized protein (DUF736 family)